MDFISLILLGFSLLLIASFMLNEFLPKDAWKECSEKYNNGGALI